MTNPEEDTPESRRKTDEEPFLFTDPPRNVPVDAVNIVVEFRPPSPDDDEPFLFTDPPRGIRFRLLEE